MAMSAAVTSSMIVICTRFAASSVFRGSATTIWPMPSASVSSRAPPAAKSKPVVHPRLLFRETHVDVARVFGVVAGKDVVLVIEDGDLRFQRIRRRLSQRRLQHDPRKDEAVHLVIARDHHEHDDGWLLEAYRRGRDEPHDV